MDENHQKLKCFRCGVSLTKFGEVQGHKICPKCFGEFEALEMEQTGKAIMWVFARGNELEIRNWFNTLSFISSDFKDSYHNIGKIQTHAYFTGPDGKRWVAKQTGYKSNFARCKRLKKQTKNKPCQTHKK